MSSGPAKGSNQGSAQSSNLAPPPGPAAVVPAIQQLRISEQKPAQRHTSKSPARMTPNASFQKLSAIESAVAATPTFKYSFIYMILYMNRF